jgi:glycosyltransferase involved in cell wall biosynthesis
VKLLIVIGRDEYARNYGQTQAFAPLLQQHECHLLIADRCSLAHDAFGVPPSLVTVLKTDDRVDHAHHEIFNILTWNQRRKSRTFYYRFSRYYRTYPYDSPRNLVRNLKGIREAVKYVLLGNRVVGKVAIPRLIRKLPVNADLERALREVKPDLVLLPCSAHDAIGDDLTRLAPELGFRTLFLVDNWDNLSSKSIFWTKPDFLGVWGEQSREHAQRIHDIGPERVSLLGTPRFERYYAIERSQVKSPYPFPYVLFCGSALAFNELEALRLLDQELSSRPDLYGELRVVYRPHPQRQTRLCPDVFREGDYRRVVLDEQLKQAYEQGNKRFQPSLDYYPSLLASARLVVCPLTTMLVESLICGTPVLAITYDDGVHYTSPHNAYRYYLHFEGIERIQGLHLNRERARLGAELRALIVQPPQLSRAAIHASLQHFIYRDGRSYADRLAAAVAQIGAGSGVAEASAQSRAAQAQTPKRLPLA